MSRLLKLGRDSLQLAKAVVESRSVKPTILAQARQRNSIASSLLHVDKQVGVVKYYGLSGYWKKQWQSTTRSAVVADESSSSPPPKAKIAFMVTASMKQELQDRLGYEEEQVKKMTPVQASLVLSQNIAPEQYDRELPKAEAIYEAEQEQAAELERKRVEQMEHERQSLQTLQSELSSTSQFFTSGGYRSRNLLAEPDESMLGFGSTWFEVTETKKGETSRVGLYLDENEAVLGMKTRQEIAESKKQDVTFDMHRLSRADL